MSATDELRRILDERGVEWETNETLTDCWTRWNVGNLRCTATEINGIFAFTIGNCTPEKAIAATLGRGTCRSTTDDNAWCFACSECNKSFPRSQLHLAHNHGEINYCPNCGARVVDKLS